MSNGDRQTIERNGRLGAVSTAILRVHADGEIVSASRAAATYFDSGEDEDLCGRNLGEFLQDDAMKLIALAIEDAGNNEAPVDVLIADNANSSVGDHIRVTLTEVVTKRARPVFQLRFDRGDPLEPQVLESRLRIATTAAGISVWELDPSTGAVSWDDSFCRIYGMDANRRQGTYAEWRERVHPDDIDEIEEQFLFSIEACEPFDGTFRILRDNGEKRTIKARAEVFADSEGRATKVVGINYDVTEEVVAKTRALEAASELKLANDRLSRLANNSPGALFEVHEAPDTAPRLAHYTAQFAQMLGVSDAQHPLTVHGALGRVYPEDLEKINQATEKARKSKSTYSLQYRIDHPDLGDRWILVKAKPVFLANHQVQWHGILFDITDFRRSEEKAAEMLRQANDRLNNLADNAPGALFEYRESADGIPSFPYTSAKFIDMLGVAEEPDPLNPATTFSKIHPEDLPEVIAQIDVSRTSMATYTVRYRINHPTLGERWILATSEPIAQDDGAIVWYGFLFDITEYQLAEERATAAVEERNKANARLSNIANVAPVGIYEMCRLPDGTSHFPYCNDHFLEISGLSRAEIGQDSASGFSKILDEDLPGVVRALDVSAETLRPFVKRFRIHNPCGGISWMSIVADVMKNDAGEIVWTGAMTDVSADVAREDAIHDARRKAESIKAENEWQALHDGLTGLPNRRYFDRNFSDRVSAAKLGRDRDAVLVRVDLDHFKHVNDILGHEAGDHVLKHVANVLKSSFRAVDFPARIGGDEFSVLMAAGTSQSDAERIIERARRALSEPIHYQDRPCRFGSSFGLAQTDDLGHVEDELHLHADAALYRAKRRGRNRLEVYTPSLHKEMTENRRIAEQLHIALEDNQFEPYFQPQFYTSSGDIAGAEILLRWKHPTDGVLAPSAFMNVAEQLKIVGEIDRVVMEKCRDALKRYRMQGISLPKVSLNVSASRMHDPNVIDLARSISSPETRIAFELLESILVEEESDVFRFHLDQIREAGIEIEIDDFGSGHASILSVMESQASALKIDQRLVKPLAHDERTRSLVRAIIEIADTLDIRTVAEGVETKQHVEILRALGCDVLQGYLFSKPLSETDFARFVKNEMNTAAGVA